MLNATMDNEDFAYLRTLDLPYEHLEGRRVLVTGANGLIASAMVDVLLEVKNVSVVAMCRNKQKGRARFARHADNPDFSILVGDVCEPLENPPVFDFIIHAASPSHPLAFSNMPVDVMNANLIGTRLMLELARAGNGKLIYISSGEIYGPNPEEVEALDEQYPGVIQTMLPRSCYPESKRAAETLCAAYHAQYGVDAAVARPCYIYGAGITEDNTRADAQFLRNVLAGEDIVMKSRGDQLRTYCYVVDCVAAILYLLLLGKSGEAYNIANRNSVITIREYAQALADAGGVSLRFEIPSEAEKSGYSKSSRSVLNAAKLETIGWRPRYGLPEGVRKMLALCRYNQKE